MNNTIKSASNEKQRSRLIFLDASKGIAILFVVAGHLIKMKPSIIDHGVFLSNLIYSFHMPVFFMISGMGLYLSFGNGDMTFKIFKDKCKKYIKRLLLCYFIWSFISYFLTCIKGTPDTEEWFWSIFTFRGRAPIWFLGALFWGEIVFLILRYLTKSKWFGIITGMLLSLIMTVICVIIMKDISDIDNIVIKYSAISISRFFPVFFFICAGYLIMGIIQSTHFNAIFYLISGIIMTILTIILQITFRNVVNMHLFTLGNPFIFFLGSTFGSLAIIMLCKAFSGWAPLKFFSHIGKNSLGIMLIHYTPFPTMKTAWSICSYLPELPGVCVYILAIIITTAISYAATILIDHKLLIK